MTWLHFQMDLSDRPDPDTFILGQLSIMEGGSVVKSFSASSGIRPHQHKKAESLKGRGPIPSCNSVDIDSYFVSTEPLDRSDNVGIQGNFYWIDTPPEVTVDRVVRSEFGIHFDANVEGSAGCIVFPKGTAANWNEFQKFIAEYNTKGFDHISLIVEYNSPPAPTVAPLFTIGFPKNKSKIQVNQVIKFQGGITDDKVKKIVVTAGPGGPFPVGEAEITNLGEWAFQKTLINTGQDRPFLFVAQDKDGKELQRQEIILSLVNVGQTLTPSKVFTITEPKSGEQKRVNRLVKFSGTAKPEVRAIVASVGPNGPFKIGTVEPVGGSWNFEYIFNSAGSNRPIWISAFDSNGNPLETAEIKISIIPGDADLSKIPAVWRPAATPHVPTLIKAFQDQGIFNPIVYAYASASISRESSWNPRAENTTDRAALSGFPGRGLAQITWDFNYKSAQEDTGIPFLSNIDLMFDPYKALRAKAAFFKRNRMIPFIEGGDYESAAGIYNAGSPRFRNSYTRNVANDVPSWIPVFRTTS